MDISRGTVHPLRMPRADKRGVNEDEFQTELQVSSYTYLDRANLLPDLGSAIDNAGGWMLDRHQVSASAVQMSVEVQQQCLPEIYGALLSSGLELTRESHRMLAERCNCCMHLPRRRGASSIVTIHVEVQFLDDPQQTTDVSQMMSLRGAPA